MEIRYSKRAVKTISGLDKPTKQRIKKAVEGLPEGDIKALKGSDNSYRLRVGDWRILFSYFETQHTDDITGETITEKGILIEKIAPRGEVYKGV